MFSASARRYLAVSRIGRKVEFVMSLRAGVFSLFTACLGAATNANALERLGTVETVEPPVRYVLNNEDSSPDYILILFPGGDGVLNARMEDGNLRYRKRTNFLLRAREFIVDKDYATVATDATHDAVRFKALAAQLKRDYPAAEIYLLATSRGTEHAMKLAPEIEKEISGIIYTASMSTITSAPIGQLRLRQLFVHHVDDPCRSTPYRAVRKAADKFDIKLVSMQGGESTGKPCQPFSHHGFNGLEQKTVEAIKQWIESRGKRWK